MGPLAVIFVAVGYGYSSWWLRAEEAAWARSFEPMQSLPRRFPKAGANQAALQLDQLARRLGIVLIGLAEDDERRKAFSSFVSGVGKTRDDSPKPAPPQIRQFLALRAAELEAVEAHLLAAGELVFEQDIEAGYAAPVPSLLGHRSLHELLLAHALEASRQGRAAEAERALDASWRLNQALGARGELISQLIFCAVAGMQNAVLRRLPAPHPHWLERVARPGLHSAMLRSFQVEGYEHGSLARGFKGVTDITDLENGAPTKTTAGKVAMRVLTAPYLRLSVASSWEGLRHSLEKLRAADVCSVDWDTVTEEATSSLPRWNVIGRIAIPGMLRAWGSFASLRLDGELTRLVLETRLERSSAGATSPPALVPSETCPGVNWVRSADRDGGVSISPDKPPLRDKLLAREWSFALKRAVTTR